MNQLKLYLAAMLIIPIAPSAHAKKQKEEMPAPCPIDGALRTADPKLLSRFSALAGCADQVLVAPAIPSDYVDPDGTVIIGSDRNRQPSRSDEASNGASYDLTYAVSSPKTVDEDDVRSSFADLPTKKSKGRKDRNAPANRAKIEYYNYGASSGAPNLSGTGVAIRIVPEPQPVDSVAPQYGASGFSAALGANDAAILSMRPQSFRTRYDDLIGGVAATHRIDPLFLHAVIYQESRYKPTAVSHAGATGLMQIMPGTGRVLGVHPRRLSDPLTNVDAGARLLRKLHGKYGGNFELMLAAYNAGEGAVAKYGNAIPPYRETQDYVKKVMAKYSDLLAEQNGVAPPQ